MLISFGATGWLIGIVILFVLLPVLWRRKHNPSTLFFFSMFWIYLLAVVQVIFFPFAINASTPGVTFTPSVNLIPFYFGRCEISAICVRGAIDNIALTIPLGFGVNFLLKIRPRNFIWLTAAIGLGFELSQWVISLAFKSGFRAIDINDGILNAAGVLLGYLIFRIFAWAYLALTERLGIMHKGLFADIYNISRQTRDNGK
jgi:glycopeptide antibiotics resistance protein